MPLILGFLWKRGTSIGAVASMVFGVIFAFYNLAVIQGINLPVFWKTGSATQSIIGIVISVIIFIVVSLITKPDYDKINHLKAGYKG